MTNMKVQDFTAVPIRVVGMLALMLALAAWGCGDDTAGTGTAAGGTGSAAAAAGGSGAPDFTAETKLTGVDVSTLKIEAGAAYLPTAPVEGLVIVDEITYWTPDNLSELINGEAESYITYDVKGLAKAEYGPDGGSDEQRITVHVYDMGTPLHAFGRFSLHKSDDYRYEELGSEGFFGGSNVIFYQGQWLVELIAGTDEGEIEKHLMNLAKAIAAKLPASDKAELEPLAKFPEGATPHSAMWAPENLADMDGFGGGYWQRYPGGDDDMKVFLRTEADDAAATAAYKEIAAALEVKPAKAAVGDQAGTFATEYNGTVVVFRKGATIGGVTDAADAAAATELAGKLAESL